MQGGKGPGSTKHSSDWLAKAAIPRRAAKMPRIVEATPELVVLLIRNLSRKPAIQHGMMRVLFS
jgi:hypothetical protein